MTQEISDKVVPKCGGCQEDLRLKIEWNMDNGQIEAAKKFLGKDRLETGEDLIKFMRYCHMCGAELTPEVKEQIRQYTNQYMEQKRQEQGLQGQE